MNDLMIHLFKASCCLMALFLFYLLFLRGETFFRLNRFYLLFVPLVSLLIPFIPLPPSESPTALALRIVLEPVMIIPESTQRSGETMLTFVSLVQIVIGSGSIFFLLRLSTQIISLLTLARHGDRDRSDNVLIVKIPGNTGPFSFFNIIFVPRAQHEPYTIRTMILHEKIHIRQAHTADLILIELFTALFWFNPFIWLIRREIKSIHEYLADRGVIGQGIPVKGYCNLIVAESTGFNSRPIVNPFNVSPLKKRLTMMTKKASPPWAAGKVALVVPLIAVLIFLLSSVASGTATAQDQSKKVIKSENPATPLPPDAPPPPPPPSKNPADEPDVMPKYPGGTEEMIKFLVGNITYPPKAIKDTVQGTVYVQCTVSKDGTLGDFKILRGVGYGCDEEALRVVKMMPKWEPALKSGKPVQTAFVLPIKFKLDGKKSEQGGKKKQAAPDLKK